MLELIKDKTYGRYWLAIVIAYLGDGMTRMAVTFLVAKQTDSPLVLSLVLLAQFMPSAVLGVLAGPLTDRYSKRKIMIAADLIRAGLLAGMVIAHHSIEWLLVLVLGCGVCKMFFDPARIASLPKLLGKHSLPKAVALFQSTVHTVNLTGPMLAGILLAGGKPDIIFAVGGAGFLISALLIGNLKVLKEGEGPADDSAKERYWPSLVTGVRDVVRIPSLRFAFLFTVPVVFFAGLFQTNFNSLLLQAFKLPALHFGMLEACLAGGAVFGALIGPMLMKKPGGTGSLMIFSSILLAITMMLVLPLEYFRELSGLVAVYLWCVVCGLANGLYSVPLTSIIFQHLPQPLVGRGLSLFNSVSHAVVLIGVFLGGWFASVAGISRSIWIGGIVLLVCVGLLRLLKGYAAVKTETVPANGSISSNK
jgi:MFS family permease